MHQRLYALVGDAVAAFQVEDSHVGAPFTNKRQAFVRDLGAAL